MRYLELRPYFLPIYDLKWSKVVFIISHLGMWSIRMLRRREKSCFEMVDEARTCNFRLVLPFPSSDVTNSKYSVCSINCVCLFWLVFAFVLTLFSNMQLPSSFSVKLGLKKRPSENTTTFCCCFESHSSTTIHALIFVKDIFWEFHKIKM